MLHLFQDDAVYLGLLVVHPAYRGQRVGHDLLKYICSSLRNTSMHAVCQKYLIPFYQRVGFAVHGPAVNRYVLTLTKTPNINDDLLILDFKGLSESQTQLVYDYDKKISKENRGNLLTLWLGSAESITKCVFTKNNESVVGFACLKKYQPEFGMDVFSMFYADDSVVETLLATFCNDTDINYKYIFTCPATNETKLVPLLETFGDYNLMGTTTSYELSTKSSLEMDVSCVYSTTTTCSEII